MIMKMRHVCLAALTKIVRAFASGRPVSGILVKFRTLPDDAGEMQGMSPGGPGTVMVSG